MAVTVAEIGRLAGCSPATVSRVMNGTGPVNPQVREAVLAAIKRSGYARERTGRRGRPPGTRKAAPNLVELLYFRDTPVEHVSMDHGQLSVSQPVPVPDEMFVSESYALSSAFYRRIADGAVQELGQWGFKGVLQFTANLVTPEALAEVNKPDRAGILLMGEYSADLGRFIDACARPLVLVDVIHEGQVDFVTTDNLAGISQAFDHLHNLGHHKIGFIGKRMESAGFMERFTTFKWKLAEAGLPYRSEWVAECYSRIDLAETATVKVLDRKDRPTALVCGNDVYAVGAMRAARKLNLDVPGELSIVGFDDTEIASLLMPPLTTVRTPTFEIGRQAVRQLMLQIQRPGPRSASIRLRPELVVRESTAKPA